MMIRFDQRPAGTSRTSGEVPAGLCTFTYDLERRWCRATFPTGKYTEVFSDVEPSVVELDKFARMGYPRTPEGVAVGRIEHEFLHTILPVELLHLPWSPEFFSQAHGFIESYRSTIPPGLRPFSTYTIPFEESLVYSLSVWIRAGQRDSGWRTKAFPEGTNALDWIAERTDLDVFVAEMRARLDGLWK